VDEYDDWPSHLLNFNPIPTVIPQPCHSLKGTSLGHFHRTGHNWKVVAVVVWGWVVDHHRNLWIFVVA